MPPAKTKSIHRFRRLARYAACRFKKLILLMQSLLAILIIYLFLFISEKFKSETSVEKFHE
ncbi:hypothetical protein E0L20_20550 [Enterobacter wuhouensis]|uniref:Uncharacterized protein n=1 Tax=Enterobacter wuhouensis TaxID=2529381 RepID=A0A4R0G268_9ENTR|nr:hypothetical protein E0L20_20550 [Enterobacter wuhouensis]